MCFSYFVGFQVGKKKHKGVVFLCVIRRFINKNTALIFICMMCVCVCDIPRKLVLQVFDYHVSLIPARIMHLKTNLVLSFCDLIKGPN